MSVLVDTGVFFAHHDSDAERHDDAVAAFEQLLDGDYGQPTPAITCSTRR